MNFPATSQAEPPSAPNAPDAATPAGRPKRKILTRQETGRNGRNFIDGWISVPRHGGPPIANVNGFEWSGTYAE